MARVSGSYRAEKRTAVQPVAPMWTLASRLDRGALYIADPVMYLIWYTTITM